MPSLFDDPYQQQNGTSLVMQPLLIQQPDPNQPDHGQGLGDLYTAITEAMRMPSDQGLLDG